jgi:hypothetical protein
MENLFLSKKFIFLEKNFFFILHQPLSVKTSWMGSKPFTATSLHTSAMACAFWAPIDGGMNTILCIEQPFSSSEPPCEESTPALHAEADNLPPIEACLCRSCLLCTADTVMPALSIPLCMSACDTECMPGDVCVCVCLCTYNSLQVRRSYIIAWVTACVCVCVGIIMQEEDDDDRIIRRSAVRTSGRSTLFCCISCGIPFTFIDSAYTSGDKEVQKMMLFVHKIRRDIRNNDHKTTALPSTQWQPNRSHYLHR